LIHIQKGPETSIDPENSSARCPSVFWRFGKELEVRRNEFGTRKRLGRIYKHF
jgi:hypothetical protein